MASVTIIFHPAFLRLAIVGWRRILANAGNRVKDDSLNLNIFPLLLGSDCVLMPAPTKCHFLPLLHLFFFFTLSVSVFAETGSQRFWFKSVTFLRLNFHAILWLWALTAALIADALCLWHVKSFCNGFCEKHSLAWFSSKPLAQTDFNLPCQKELLLEAMMPLKQNPSEMFLYLKLNWGLDHPVLYFYGIFLMLSTPKCDDSLCEWPAFKGRFFFSSIYVKFVLLYT